MRHFFYSVTSGKNPTDNFTFFTLSQETHPTHKKLREHAIENRIEDPQILAISELSGPDMRQFLSEL